MADPSRFILLAASDDFLLEQAVARALAQLRPHLRDAELVNLSADSLPEDVALELSSPSLFSPERILLVNDARGWVKSSTPRGAPPISTGIDVTPLVRGLEDGMPDGVALVIGAWCGSQPRGPLVEVAQKIGTMTWVPAPEPPKPWEDAVVSDAQRDVLRTIIQQAAPDIRFSATAERLLLERLGFAPRRLAQEAAKLAAAAATTQQVDEQLVRRLVLQRDGSLDELQKAVLERDARQAAAFLDKARRGTPIADWSGQRLSDRDLAFRVFNLVADAAVRMLYLRRTATLIGAEAELDPKRNEQRGWYSRVFKNRLGPALLGAIAEDPGSPFGGASRTPKPWTLHLLFRGAGRYHEKELARAVVDAATVERRLRRSGDAIDALPAWVMQTLTTP